MPITPFPTPPNRANPATFADLGDAFLGHFPVFSSEVSALEANVDAKEISAVSASNIAVAATNAIAWVTATTYAVGNVRYSPANGQAYRRRTVGAGTTDPSLDGANWWLLSTLPVQTGKAGRILSTNGQTMLWVSRGVATYYMAQYTASSTFVVPADTFVIRAYAFGAGGAGATSASGGGGGCAFGDIEVTPAQVVTVTISAGVATVTTSAIARLTANAASGITGGTASKHASVTNGGNFSGGAGFASTDRPGASSGSPLGVGFASAAGSGGSGWGGAGSGLGAGGVGGPSVTGGGPGLSLPSIDPLLDGLVNPSTRPYSNLAMPGFDGAPGLGGSNGGATNQPGGAGGFGAGGGRSIGNATGGAGGFGGGGGASSNGVAAGGAAGAAVIRIYY